MGKDIFSFGSSSLVLFEIFLVDSNITKNILFFVRAKGVLYKYLYNTKTSPNYRSHHHIRADKPFPFTSGSIEDVTGTKKYIFRGKPLQWPEPAMIRSCKSGYWVSRLGAFGDPGVVESFKHNGGIIEHYSLL